MAYGSTSPLPIVGNYLDQQTDLVLIGAGVLMLFSSAIFLIATAAVLLILFGQNQ
jgi:hypothetical protein